MRFVKYTLPGVSISLSWTKIAKKKRRTETFRPPNKKNFVRYDESAAVPAREDADDLRACVVDLAEWSDARLDGRLEIFRRCEVAALQERRLRLVRLEELADALEEILWLRILRKQEYITCHIAEIRIDMQHDMSFAEQRRNRIMLLLNLMALHIDDPASETAEQVAEHRLDGLHLLQLAVLAMIKIHRQLTS